MPDELAKIQSTAVASFFETGDISGMSASQQVQYYCELAQSLGLNPLFKPFDALNLQGKKVLYANRGATDALARAQNVKRECVSEPRVVSLPSPTGTGEVKIVMCRYRATLPNGRAEERTATVIYRDPANDFMKCETKAARRATLAVLGIGVLDESELDSIPGARVPTQAMSEASALYLAAAVERVLSHPVLCDATAPKEARQAAWDTEVQAFASLSGQQVKEAYTSLGSAVLRAKGK
jgi:hypothetical protein